MATRAPKSKPPEGPTQLLTLTEEQAQVVTKAMRELEIQSRAAKEAQARLEELLSMVRPEGANAFDPKTMTFYSVPEGAPKETQDA